MTKFAGKWKTLSAMRDVPSPVLVPPEIGIPNRNPQARSLSTSGGSAAKLKSNVYTGDQVVGIATLHKSNAVPVFSQEEAKDVARMRR